MTLLIKENLKGYVPPEFIKELEKYQNVFIALTKERDRFKKLRDKYDEEGKMKDYDEAHLIWYYLDCCLNGISFDKSKSK